MNDHDQRLAELGMRIANRSAKYAAILIRLDSIVKDEKAGKYTPELALKLIDAILTELRADLKK